MKYIIAIIQPGKLDAVHEALIELGVTGLTATEVQGYGRQKGKSEVYRGAEYVVNFLPKVKIEIAVPSKLAVKTIETIKDVSNTGKIGDGKIFTFDLADALRIRTGETGEAAL
jgi:nitrogen regulatory protein P-II 2